MNDISESIRWVTYKNEVHDNEVKVHSKAQMIPMVASKEELEDAIGPILEVWNGSYWMRVPHVTVFREQS